MSTLNVRSIAADGNISARPCPPAAKPRVPNRIFWRKQLMHRRRSLEIQWRQLFARHSFSDLRLIRSPDNAPPRGWDEHWREAARAYHEERQRKQRGAG